MVKLAIVILNYRTPQLVIDCLKSLETEVQVNPMIQVIVVDNNSADDSIPIIEKAIQDHTWQNWAKLIASPVNGGFSAGNNIGIQSIEAEAYLLLNSDTIIRSGAIAHLLEAMANHPEAGIISPRLEWPDGTPQISCFRNHSSISELIDAAATNPITKLFNQYNVPIPVSDQPHTCEWTSFACVLVRKSVIDQIGLMDAGYFMYFDDIDFCRRSKKAGWQILHWPIARVVHLRGGSSSVKADVKQRKRPPKYLYASRSRYFTKFYGITGLWVANLFWYIGRSVSFLRELVGNKEPHTCEKEIWDIWTNCLYPMQHPPSSNAEKKHAKKT